MTTLDLKQFENLAARSRSPVDLDGGEPFVYLPMDCEIKSVEQYLPAPVRIKRHLKVSTLDGFNRYFNEFKGKVGVSRIFSHLDSVNILGILDDHFSQAPAGEMAMWGSHRVTYKCPYSRQWEAWMAQDRRKVGQVEFAEWLEDRVADVTEPVGTELLSLCTHLQIHRKVAYGSATQLATGETSFSYSEDNQAGTVEIPASIKLGIPVFQDGTPYEITARFRYRLSEGNLQLWYELVEPQKYVEDAFAAVVDEIASETDIIPIAAEHP